MTAARLRTAAASFTHHPRDFEGEAWSFDPTRAYEQLARPAMKPKGFWLGVDGDWKRWCDDEESSWASVAPVNFLVNTDRMLWLRSAEAIDAFHAEHCAPYATGHEPDYIDWGSIADRYAGIIIAPYQWSRRLDGPHWYYSWDCASACVWDLSALAVADAVLGAEVAV